MSTTKTKTITWHCAVCGEPVEDGAGYLEVSDAEVHEVEQRRGAARRRARESNPYGLEIYSGADLRNLAEDAPWRVQHRDCDPQPDAGAYSIAIERVRTPELVLARTAHLLEKSWLKATNWPAILRHAAGGAS